MGSRGALFHALSDRGDGSPGQPRRDRWCRGGRPAAQAGRRGDGILERNRAGELCADGCSAGTHPGDFPLSAAPGELQEADGDRAGDRAFLGLTPMGSPTTRGKVTGRRCPSATRLRKQRQEVTQTRRERMPWPIATLGAWLTRVVVGHYRSSGVPRNRGRLRVCRDCRLRDWCRIVRRRSQRQRLTWQRRYPLATPWLPAPHLRHPYPAQRWRVTTQGKSPVRSCRTPGSVRGVSGNRHPYRDRPRQRRRDVLGIMYHRLQIVSQYSLDYDSVSIINPWRPSSMSLTELVPAIRRLPRADKLRLMQFLVIDLAQEEGIPLLSVDAEYPIW